MYTLVKYIYLSNLTKNDTDKKPTNITKEKDEFNEIVT